MQRGICHNNRVGNSFGELPDPNHSERVRFTMATDSNTREIPLTQGKVALVDAADYETLAQWKWRAERGGHTFYAGCGGGTYPRMSMHRIIMGDPKGMLVDHINHNGLDNRRSNLRICTRAENGRNRKPDLRVKSSRHKGVWWSTEKSRWLAKIYVNGKRICLGTFTVEDDAARSYDAAALVHHGAFACLNFEGNGID